MPTTALRNKVRLYIGDTDVTRQLFTDAEIDLVIDDPEGANGNALVAAADCCDILATRFAREHDFEWEGSQNARGKFNRSQMSKMYADRAKQFRQRSPAGQVGSASTSRVDGFSEDITSRDGAGETSRTGRVRAGYFNPDLPY